jgi:hypothetical protein
MRLVVTYHFHPPSFPSANLGTVPCDCLNEVGVSCDSCQHIVLGFSPTYLVVHGVPTRDVFPCFVSRESLVSELLVPSHYLFLLTSIFAIIFGTSASVVVLPITLLLNMVLFLLCATFCDGLG